MIIEPRNWSSFQHYKDRSPAWIKLHRSILDDYEYHCLPLASKALAPFLWLLASEYQDGKIIASGECLSFRLRMSLKDFMQALEPLKNSGFFSVYQDASELLADCKQDACLEKRREERETEKEKRKILCKTGFEKFWDAFDYKRGKEGAIRSWNNITGMNSELIECIVIAAGHEALQRPELLKRGGSPKMAQGWLSDKRWEDQTPQLLPTKTETTVFKSHSDRLQDQIMETSRRFAERMEAEKNGTRDVFTGNGPIASGSIIRGK